jgi:hypothetical protein
MALADPAGQIVATVSPCNFNIFAGHDFLTISMFRRVATP